MNMETFQQILELDEDEDERDFSWAMADAFFSQALATFESMDKAL
jgi:osomolarity two-component system, phosphorelay intermediate protein YPD1